MIDNSMPAAAIATTIIRCQSLVKSIYGDEYKDKVEIYLNVLRGHNISNNTKNLLESLILILSEEDVIGNGSIMIMFIAAYAESVEFKK